VAQRVRLVALHGEVRAHQHVDHDAAAVELQAQRLGHEGNAVRQHQHRGVARAPAVLLEARVEQADLRRRRIVFC
jgi:nucleotide-binding universal stress UspA family protein